MTATGLESTTTSDFTPALGKEFLEIQANIECGLTLKCVHDMIRTYSELQSSEKKTQKSFKSGERG